MAERLGPDDDALPPRAAFVQVDEYESGWLAEGDLRAALRVAGVAVTPQEAAASVARLAAERGQEEDGFLSIDEFETIHGWHGRPAASRPEPEPEREPEPAAGGGGPDAEDAFDTRDYWEKFNADPGCYEWYGGDGLQESIVQSVVQCARLVRPDRPTAARVLDVGTGTSPILFLLTERERFTAVEGTDWSARACDFMSAQAEQRGLRECLRYRQADGRRLDAVYDEGSWDVVLDKGCLDCFVSGRGHADIAVYLAQLRRLLAPPAGRLLLVPVNGAHIPTLLATGSIVREAHMTQRSEGQTSNSHASAGGAGRTEPRRFPACDALPAADIAAYADAAWEEHCAPRGGCEGEGEGGEAGPPASARRDWQQMVFIEKVVAMEEKHMFVCALQPLQNGLRPTLDCGACGKSYRSEDYPDRCTRCQSKLARWCLS